MNRRKGLTLAVALVLLAIGVVLIGWNLMRPAPPPGPIDEPRAAAPAQPPATSGDPGTFQGGAVGGGPRTPQK